MYVAPDYESRDWTSDVVMTITFTIDTKICVYVVFSLFVSICNGAALPKPEDYVRKDLGETARYLFRREDDFEVVYCYYCPPEAGRSDAKRREYVVDTCYNKNSEIRDEYEKNKLLFPYCRKGKKIACPPLPAIDNIKWDCGDEDINEVRVYRSCLPTCDEGYHLDLNVSYWCGELRQWHGNVSTARCLKNDPIMSTGIEMTTNSQNITTISSVKFENNVSSSVVSGTERDLAPTDDSTVHREGGRDMSNKTVSPKLKIDVQDPKEINWIIPVIGCVVGIIVIIIFGIIIRCLGVRCNICKGQTQKKNWESSSEDKELSMPLNVVAQQSNDKKETEFPGQTSMTSSTSSSVTITESSGSGSDRTEDTKITHLEETDPECKEEGISLLHSNGCISGTSALSKPLGIPGDVAADRSHVAPGQSASPSDQITILDQRPVKKDSKEKDFPDIPNDGYISGVSALSKPLGIPGDFAANRPHVAPGESASPKNQIAIHHQRPLKTERKEEGVSLLHSNGCISGTSALSKPLGIPGDIAADRPHVAPGQSASPSDQITILDQRPVKKESQPKANVTEKDNTDVISVLPSQTGTEKTKFRVVEGSKIYISANCKKHEGDEFQIRKNKQYRGKQFHPKFFTFIHVIESVQDIDSGKYCWHVQNASNPNRKLSGSFMLEVIKSQPKMNIPQPCEPQYNVKAPKRSGCTYKVSSFLEDSDPELVKNIYYVLDFEEDWYGLARTLLPHNNKNLFKSIKYHKRGDPNDGPSEYILTEMLCAEDFSVGDIVEYFTQEKVKRKKILKEPLFKEHYAKCNYCEDIVCSIDFGDILSSDDSH